MKPSARFIVADVRDGLAQLADGSAGVVCTSPPYWAKCRYTSDPREVGQGPLADYVADLVGIFREVRRVLAPTGVLWLNVGDSASGSGGAGSDYKPGGSRAGRRTFRQGDAGLASRQWCDVPWRVVHALQEDGWLLRSTVVWNKGRSKRESLLHARRPGDQWEPVFMLVPANSNRHGLTYGFHPERMSEKGNVWNVAPCSDKEHPAVFPAELVRRCLEPLEAKTLLDPFCGTGTALGVAVGCGLSAVGIDFDPKNREIARQRLGLFLVEEPPGGCVREPIPA